MCVTAYQTSTVVIQNTAIAAAMLATTAITTMKRLFQRPRSNIFSSRSMGSCLVLGGWIIEEAPAADSIGMASIGGTCMEMTASPGATPPGLECQGHCPSGSPGRWLPLCLLLAL